MADKVFTYLMIIFCVSLIFHVSGIIPTPTTTVGMMIQAVQGTDFKLNDLWVLIAGDKVFLVLAGLAAIGAFVFGNSSAAVTAASVVMAKFLVDFISDIIAVLKYIGNGCDIYTGSICEVVYWIAFLILAPLTLGFAYSLFQFVRGDD